VGIGAAVATLAHVIERALEEYPVPMAALFFGLVAGSAIVACRMLDEWTARRIALLIGVMALTALLLGLQSSERADAPLWLFGVAGAVAICAMILPGVSGSFLLLTIGMYELVLSAVTERDLGTLLVFAVGCVVGLGLFSSGLSWALENHRDTVLAALVGLMIGSLRVLWPWPAGTDNTGLAVPREQWGLALAIAVLAFLAVVVVSEIGERRKELALRSPVSD
jgi:putative membrane protein